MIKSLFKLNTILILFLGFLIANQESAGKKSNWPKNTTKDKLDDVDFDMDCVSSALKSIGCNCSNDGDCNSGACYKGPKGSFCIPVKGTQVPRFQAIDQYGEVVDLYDFAHQNKIIALELGTTWCSPCKDLAAWFSVGDEKVTQNPWWKNDYFKIKELIEEDQIFFVTVLFEDIYRDDATPETVSQWHEDYPSQQIPVLADEYRMLYNWIKPTGFPVVVLLDENMKLLNYTHRGLNEAFDILSGIKKVRPNKRRHHSVKKKLSNKAPIKIK